jgi:hypothetical protein
MPLFTSFIQFPECTGTNKQTNSMAWVRERTIPTERPPLLGEVVANFSDKGCHVVSVTDPYGRILDFLDRRIKKTVYTRRQSYLWIPAVSGIKRQHFVPVLATNLTNFSLRREDVWESECIDRWYSTWGTRRHLRGMRKLTSIKMKHRIRLNLEPVLILAFTKIRPRIEVLTCRNKLSHLINRSEPH